MVTVVPILTNALGTIPRAYVKGFEQLKMVPVMLELWGMRSTPSVPLLPGTLWPGMVSPDRGLSRG